MRRPAFAALVLALGAVGGLAAAQAPVVPRDPGPLPDPALVIQPERGIYGHLLEGRFQEPRGVYWDRWEEELFIVDRGGSRIAIADERGVPTYSFGHARFMQSPRSAVTDRQGRVFVADSGYPEVRVFDYDGTVLADLDLSKLPEMERPLQPSALAIDADERLYILDGGNRRIIVTDLEGGRVRTLPAPIGRGDLMRAPVDLAVAPDGRIVVSDATGLAVQIYEPSGQFVRGWGAHEIGASNFSLPAGLAVDAAGRIYIADTLRHDVKVFSPEGDFLTNFGGFGAGPGQLAYPVDVAADRAGRIFVAERVGRRVQIYRVTRP